MLRIGYRAGIKFSIDDPIGGFDTRKILREISATEILPADVDVVGVDSTSGPITVTIPTEMWDQASSITARELILFHKAGGGTITVNMQEGSGTQTLYGGSTYVLPTATTDVLLLTNPAETSGSGIGYLSSRYTD